MRLIKITACLWVLWLLPVITAAQTVYVTDQLSLKLRGTPASDGTVIMTLKSGDKLTLIEKQNGFSKVRTGEGKSGWVQSWYVSPEIPVTYLLEQANLETEQLKQQLDSAENKLSNFNSVLSDENNELKNTVSALSDKIKSLTNEQDLLNEKLSQQASKYAKYEFADKYNIFLILSVLLLSSFLLGFFASLKWSRRQESKRLSGYKLAHK